MYPDAHAVSPGSDPASAALPGICQRVDWLLPAGLIANGVAVMLFGLTKATSFISILSRSGDM